MTPEEFASKIHEDGLVLYQGRVRKVHAILGESVCLAGMSGNWLNFKDPRLQIISGRPREEIEANLEILKKCVVGDVLQYDKKTFCLVTDNSDPDTITINDSESHFDLSLGYYYKKPTIYPKEKLSWVVGDTFLWKVFGGDTVVDVVELLDDIIVVEFMQPFGDTYRHRRHLCRYTGNWAPHEGEILAEIDPAAYHEFVKRRARLSIVEALLSPKEFSLEVLDAALKTIS